MRTNELLEQDRIWITADRMPMLITEMHREHRRCTLAMLRRRAKSLQQAYLFCEVQDMLRCGDETVTPAVLELYDDPEKWLERRPLIRELKRLVLNDGAINAEVVTVDEIEAAR